MNQQSQKRPSIKFKTLDEKYFSAENAVMLIAAMNNASIDNQQASIGAYMRETTVACKLYNDSEVLYSSPVQFVCSLVASDFLELIEIEHCNEVYDLGILAAGFGFDLKPKTKDVYLFEQEVKALNLVELSTMATAFRRFPKFFLDKLEAITKA